MAPESNPSAITLLHPLPGRVVLRRTEPAAAPSPYVIPDQAREKPVEAVVVAIPRLPYYEYGILIPCPVNEGDLCLVGKYAGDVKFRNEDATIIRWDEILAVISKPSDDLKPFTYGDINRASAKEYVDAVKKGIPLLHDKTDEYESRVDQLKQAADKANLPSAADLDAVADERRAEELTARFLNKVAREGGQQPVDNPPDRAVPRL